jgi:hypothetical protein
VRFQCLENTRVGVPEKIERLFVQEWKSAETKNMKFWGGVMTIILGLIIFAL